MILLTSSKGEPVLPLPLSCLLLPSILSFFQEKEVIFRKHISFLTEIHHSWTSLLPFRAGYHCTVAFSVLLKTHIEEFLSIRAYGQENR